MVRVCALQVRSCEFESHYFQALVQMTYPTINMWIFYVLSFLTIFFGCRTIMSKEPISSVVNLVGTFVSCAGIWIFLEIHLLGLIYIIVYVGAIAILFIFVIMMMDLSHPSGPSPSWTPPVLGSALTIWAIWVALGVGVVYLQGTTVYQDYFSIWEIAQRNIWDSLLISLDLIHSVGYILYTDLLSLLLVVSLILLMIMIGVIVIIKD